ncbi:ABC transporter permease [Mesorhizobium sp. CAU 1732]|uniref:ABC transporter permease n=1 Tax=Mesorhizobium sp. CAU 1732 TaxID=3140358 RepID=UPI0032618B70
MRVIYRQLLQGLLVIWIVLSATFVLVRLSGDPVAILLPENPPQEAIDLLQAKLGLDRPIYVQYVDFLSSALTGDMGQSYFEGSSVSEIIGRHLGNTLLLAGVAFIASALIAIPTGIYAAVYPGSFGDRLLQVTAVVFSSIPAFWLALLLVQFFALYMNWLPTYGTGTWRHLVLPAATLTLISIPSLARLTRSSLLEVLPLNYVQASRAKGMPERRVVLRVVLRNALVPIITLLTLEIGSLLGGAVVTETVFSWPGIGHLTVVSLQRRDFPIVQGVVIYVSIIFVVITIVNELLIRLASPRLRGDA